MQFCNSCKNMMYLSIDEMNPNILLLYCRQCGTTQSLQNNTISIASSSIENSSSGGGSSGDDSSSFAHYINPFTKYDPTLPRTNAILCPNENCSTNHGEGRNDREIITIRYDDKNMKYMYLCSTCDTVWKCST